MAEFAYEIKITKDRIAVLIGKNGEIKKQIEDTTHTTIKIDSTEGDVQVRGEDALSLYVTRDIIQAISRGVNPEIALRLLKPEYMFEQIDINDYSKKSNHQIRLKGRIIGKDGRARKTIEELTNSNITIYGKTISIVGETEMVSLARRAIESLLQGSPHANVYHFLEKQRRKMRLQRIEARQQVVN